jgi:uncharacterized protein (DUF2267 family)
MSTAPDPRPDAIDTTVQKTYRWLRELAAELGGTSREEAYDVLRGFLQTLRDRLTVDEAAHLGAQLPMLVRGFFYEGWDPSGAPKKMKADAFLKMFARRSRYRLDGSAEEALKAANRILRRHVTEGEAVEVINGLPKDIRALLE